MRRVSPWSRHDNNGSRALFIIIFLTIAILSSIALRTVATDGSTSISANCNECHEPSIYLIVEIRFIDAPTMIVRNESTLVNISVEVSSSHKSFVWSGFGMDVWLVPGTDHTNCGPHQVMNGLKPYGQSSPYSWTKTFSFLINSSLIGNETVTVNAKMSPIHESPPVTAKDQFTIPIVTSRNETLPPSDNSLQDDDVVIRHDDDQRSKLGLVGLSIVVIGGSAVIAGLIYAGYSLMAPVENRKEGGKNRGGQTK